MLSYIARRILALVPVLFVVTTAVFVITYFTPGDPAEIILGDDATPRALKALHEQMGLDRPMYVQYLTWIGGVLVGNFGTSYLRDRPVLEIIAGNIQPTVSLAVYGLTIALIIAIPAGIYAAKNRGRKVDHFLMTTTLLGMSVPSFVLGIILIMVVGVQLGWLPVAGYRQPSAGLIPHLTYLTLPAICVGLITSAFIARMTRSSVLEVLGANYITTARSKGLSEFLVLNKHALKNAFLPILTVIGQTFGGLVSGAVVVETIFNIPGLGQLALEAIGSRDAPLLQGIVLLVAFAYVAVNLLVDLLYGVLDPRVRLASKAVS